MRNAGAAVNARAGIGRNDHSGAASWPERGSWRDIELISAATVAFAATDGEDGGSTDVWPRASARR